MAQLSAHYLDFETSGVRVAAIGLGDPHYARMFREETTIPFALLIDLERKAYQAAELKKASPLQVLQLRTLAERMRARANGMRQPKILLSKLTQNPLQLGGSFVFGPGNVDLYAHVSTRFGDNADVHDLLAAARSAEAAHG